MATLEWLKKHINTILSLVLSMVVIFVAIYRGSELVDAMKQVRLKWVVFGLGCYGMNYLFRSIRLKMILGDRISLWPNAIHAACLHGLATYLLPFRSGDLTLPVILKKNVDLKMSEGAMVLIKARLLDLSALGLWILWVSIIIDFTIPPLVHRLWVLSGIGLIIFPIIVQLGIKKSRYLQGKIWQKIIELSCINPFSLQEVLISIGIWAWVAACFFCTAQAIGLPLNFMQIWLLITIQLPLQLVPLQGVANAGNHEGGWVAGLALLGIPASQGLHFALLSHALVMIYVLTLGPASFFIKMLQKRNARNHPFEKPTS